MSGDRRPHRREMGYCSACGERLDPSANYCSGCGTPTGDGPATTDRRSRPPTGESQPADPRSHGQPATAGTSNSRAALEREIAIAVEDGWELKHDFGDHAVMVRRRFGSVAGHLVVALCTIWWTMGIGNVLYGAYRYFGDADRRVLRAENADTVARADGPTTASNDHADLLSRRTAGVYWLLAVALVGVGLVASSSLLTLVFAVLAGSVAIVGLATMPSVRNRLDRRHPVTATGRVRSVDERAVVAPDQPCAACAVAVDPGIERTYRKELCLFGVPLSTETGRNYYCRQCANAERMDDLEAIGDVGDPATGTPEESDAHPTVVDRATGDPTPESDRA